MRHHTGDAKDTCPHDHEGQEADGSGDTFDKTDWNVGRAWLRGHVRKLLACHSRGISLY